MNTPLRWGLLSTARINHALIRAVRASKRSSLQVVASRSQSAADAYAQEWEIPRAYGSYEALLADTEIDVIYNPLPNHLHAEWSIRALQAGKHVLCEKPLALSVQEVDAMALAAQASGRTLTEAFMYRHHPQTFKVKEIVDSGVLGTLNLVRGSFTFTLTRAGNFRRIRDMGGGSIWDVGCYPISYVRMLLGAEPSAAFGWQILGSGEVDETFVGQMRFPGNVYAQFDCGFSAPLRSHLEIVGTRGALTVPSPFKPGRSEKVLVRQDERTETISIPGQELYVGEVEDICDAILLGTPPRVSLADSRGNVAAILGLLESARTGKVVSL